MRCEIREIGKKLYAMSILDSSDGLLFIHFSNNTSFLYNKAKEEYGFDKDEVIIIRLQLKKNTTHELIRKSQEHRQSMLT